MTSDKYMEVLIDALEVRIGISDFDQELGRSMPSHIPKFDDMLSAEAR